MTPAAAVVAAAERAGLARRSVLPGPRAKPPLRVLRLIWIKAPLRKPPQKIAMDWHNIASAPFTHDLELAVIDSAGTHALVFPCRRVLSGWINAETKQFLDVRPTHWREWPKGNGDARA